jgi:hypothetical protein
VSRAPSAPGDRVRALFAWWQHRQPRASPALDETLEVLLRRYEIDRARYSDIFEPSLSWSARGPSLRRFSYAFPRAAPDDAARALTQLCAPWGGAVVDTCARAVRAARHAAVEQPLFGLADDGDDGLRVKLYLQFRDGASDGAIAIARAMIGAPLERLDGALHMLGLDVSERGLRAAKLYVVPHAASPTELIDLPIARPLLVYRLLRPDDPLAAPELDFGLVENSLSEAQLLATPLLVARHPEALRALAELRSELALTVRRVSIAPGRVTLYYVLNAG